MVVLAGGFFKLRIVSFLRKTERMCIGIWDKTVVMPFLEASEYLRVGRRGLSYGACRSTSRYCDQESILLTWDPGFGYRVAEVDR